MLCWLLDVLAVVVFEMAAVRAAFKNKIPQNIHRKLVKHEVHSFLLLGKTQMLARVVCDSGRHAQERGPRVYQWEWTGDWAGQTGSTNSHEIIVHAQCTTYATAT